MNRFGFCITFMNIRTNDIEIQEFVSYSYYTKAWKECLAYAEHELITKNKYTVIKSIEYIHK